METMKGGINCLAAGQKLSAQNWMKSTGSSEFNRRYLSIAAGCGIDFDALPVPREGRQIQVVFLLWGKSND